MTRSNCLKITLFSLFPDWFDGPLGDSILQRAKESGYLDIQTVNFREYSKDRHQSVDAAPYGGGGGMVLRPDVLANAMDSTIGAPQSDERPYTILMSPRGRKFDQQVAIELAKKPALAFVCGHYEAVDQRLIDTRIDEEISIGDFVLTGGEIPAMAMIDSIARMIPGVLGNETSAELDSFMDGLLEAPHYTRPEEFEGLAVPPVLLSGNHREIEKWREDSSLKLTRKRRPDLYECQWLGPESVRRLARRGKPFAIWELDRNGSLNPLFICSAVTALPNWKALLTEGRFQKGLTSTIRFAEIREASSGDEDLDRARVIQDVRCVLGKEINKGGSVPVASSQAEIFLRNYLRVCEV